MRIIVGLLAILISTSAASVASAMERTPPGSYLVYRATSVAQLRKQIATNRLVQARYSKHFGISPKKLDEFIADNIQLIAVKAPLSVESWYVDRKGKTCIKKKLLPAGTMVFATLTGEPVLAWSCGNPLRTNLPVTKVKADVTKIMTDKTPLDIQTKVGAQPMEIISTAVVTAPPTPAVVSIVPVESAPVLSFVAAPAVSMPPLMGGLNNLAGWLGALGGVAMFHKGPTFVTTPEPSTVVAIGSMLGLMPMLFKTRRRRQ